MAGHLCADLGLFRRGMLRDRGWRGQERGKMGLFGAGAFCVRALGLGKASVQRRSTGSPMLMSKNEQRSASGVGAERVQEEHIGCSAG